MPGNLGSGLTGGLRFGEAFSRGLYMGQSRFNLMTGGSV